MHSPAQPDQEELVSTESTKRVQDNIEGNSPKDLSEFSKLLGAPKQTWRNIINLSIMYIKSNYTLNQIPNRKQKEGWDREGIKMVERKNIAGLHRLLLL